MVGGELERADGHIEFEARERAREPDRSRVDVAARALKLGDHVQRRDLRRAGHRARWERGANEGGVVGAGRQPAAHLGDEVPHAGVGAGVGDHVRRDRSRAAHATEVVAHEVDDHHILGPVLGGGAQRLPRARRGVGVGRLADRALDRGAADVVAAAFQEQLGGEAGDRAPRPFEIGRAVGAERLDTGEEHIERVAVDPRIKSHADVRLKQVSGVDPPPARLDGALVAARAGRAAPRIRAERPRPGGACGAAARVVSSARRACRRGAASSFHSASNHHCPSGSRRRTWS